MSIQLSSSKTSGTKSKTKPLHKKMSSEDFEVLEALKKLQLELECMHKNLDYVTNPVLIDSCIYELKALHMKYEYYLSLCKERGITSAALA